MKIEKSMVYTLQVYDREFTLIHVALEMVYSHGSHDDVDRKLLENMIGLMEEKK